MSKNIYNRVAVDAAMFITMAISFITGVVLWLVYPSGQGSSKIVYLGLIKHSWIDLHVYLSFVFVGILLLHMALNRALFKSMVNCIIHRA